ncbi:MAG: BsaWI family type II restriction enzyme [Candidatus Bathyarchaeota archaeon]|nr:BsaWI family type II restriction enzyme [Candidatus Bathyarchaeota archaeon]
MKDETAVERQSRVAKTGRGWEDYVQQYLSKRLRGTDITILKGNEIPKNSYLWRKLSIPTKVSTVEESVWGDIDLVAVKGKIIIAVISCKLSLHGRFTESLFYSLLFRMTSRTKFVLVTPDAGRGQTAKWSSEWGKPEEPTKDRMLAESYIDGVYVENVAEFCPRKKPDEHTNIGGIIRGLNELPEDLIRWGEENSKFVYIRRGS